MILPINQFSMSSVILNVLYFAFTFSLITSIANSATTSDVNYPTTSLAKSLTTSAANSGINNPKLIANSCINNPKDNNANGSDKYLVLFNNKEWQLPNSAQILDGGKGLLLHRTNSGTVRVTSKAKYRYATLDMDVRFGEFRKGVYYYLGFMSRKPWAKNVVWLNNDGMNHFFIRTTRNGRNNTISKSATPKLEENKWYHFRLEWTKAAVDRPEIRSDTVSFYLNGKKIGTYGNIETMPTEMLPVVFDIDSRRKADASIEIRNLKIIPHGKTIREAILPDEIPIPPRTYVPNTKIVRTKPIIKLKDGKAVLSNGFFQYDIDLNTLHITRIINKYTNTEMIYQKSRLFVINANGKNVPTSDYKLIEANISSKPANSANYTNTANLANSDRAVINASWENTKNAFRVNMSLTVLRDSAEMLVSFVVKNLGTNKLIVGITEPFIENIKIGQDVKDDYYFFPMMTGWCGKLPLRLCHAYGYTANMQLLEVFNPSLGSGVFAYVRDATGMPKLLLINKRDKEDEDPVPHNTSLYSQEDPGKIFNKQPGIAMAVRHLRYELDSGQSCELPISVIGVSCGDWHDGFKHYKKWVRSWFHKLYPLPKWFRDNYDYISEHPHGGVWPSHGFIDKEDKHYIYSKYMGTSEIGAMTEWAFWWENSKKRRDSIPAQYSITRNCHGDYDYNTRWGGLKGLRDEIRKVHQKGGRIILYTLAIGCSDESKIGRVHGAEWGRKNKKGEYTRSWIQPGHGYNACCYVKGWQEYLSSRMATVLKETGADGYRLDVAAGLYPCYNPKHKHYKGTIRSTVSPKAMGEFLEICSRRARQANPEAIVMTEHIGNEYLGQFIDGYLTQQFNWATPFWGRCRGMSAYNLVFMRFLLPEVKVIVFGFDPADGGRRAFFNAIGQDRGSAKGKALEYLTRTHRVLIENSDAFNTLEPRALIPTLKDGVMANAFPCKTKRVWTIWNRNTKAVNGKLFAIDGKKNVHYVEMLNDVPVKIEREGNQTIICGTIGANEVLAIAELPVVLSAKLSDGILKINVDKKYPDAHIAMFFDDDKLEKMIPVKVNKGSIALKITGSHKIIIKLMRDNYVVDERIIQN